MNTLHESKNNRNELYPVSNNSTRLERLNSTEPSLNFNEVDSIINQKIREFKTDFLRQWEKNHALDVREIKGTIEALEGLKQRFKQRLIEDFNSKIAFEIRSILTEEINSILNTK